MIQIPLPKFGGQISFDVGDRTPDRDPILAVALAYGISTDDAEEAVRFGYAGEDPPPEVRFADVPRGPQLALRVRVGRCGACGAEVAVQNGEENPDRIVAAVRGHGCRP